MRNIIQTLSLLLVCSLCFTTLSAQTELTKEEVKYWKGKAKEYRRNLPALKNLVESRDAAEDQVVDLQQQVNTLQTQVSMKDRQLVAFEEQVANLNQRILEAETASMNVPTQPVTPPVTSSGAVANTSPSVSGTVFRIQLAALNQKKIDRTLATGNSMVLMEDRDGLQKVMVGEFRTYINARTLRDRLRQIGVKGAFIQAFQDGKPIDIRTAVQYTGEQVD
ncbi:hypothetical protein CEQ90_11265 [Lewinellaceae bacterium SD302]|nr:hypothetical protein CEQ90_11265 [Lewinellaceae bacterium SD302]